MGAPSLSLVVPVFNEEARLSEHGQELADFVAAMGTGSELVIVDDRSRDRTVAVAEALAGRNRSLAVSVMSRRHLGKGAALRAGLGVGRGSVLAFCDVDCATPLDQVERLVTVASWAPALVIGSRGVVSSDLVEREGAVREHLGRAYNRLVRLTLTPSVHDTQCGAKAAPRRVWQEILPRSRENGFAWDVEMITLAQRRGIAVWELGIRWSHDRRSRVRPLRDGAAMVAAIPRVWRRARSVPSAIGTGVAGLPAPAQPRREPSLEVLRTAR